VENVRDIFTELLENAGDSGQNKAIKSKYP
jgi:hypothetical protein